MHYHASMTQLIHRQDQKLFYHLPSSLHPSIGILWKKFSKPNKRSHPLQNARLARSMFHPVFALEIIQWVHTSLASGHPGINHTTALVRNSFWLPTLSDDVNNYVTTCQICAQSRTPRQLPAGLL